jgi:phosphoglycerol transferase MdoB-like AlkP superfamily enzyme
VPLFMGSVTLRSIDGIELSWDFLAGLLIVSAFLWILGALFAFVLLLPLMPIADRVRPVFSLPLFLLVGTGIAAYLGNQLLHMPTHGGPPPYETQSTPELAYTIISAGVMGMGCAAASWFSVRWSRSAGASPNTSLERTRER